MKIDNTNVLYVKWGLANWYEDKIELNENLIKYPKLHDYIIKHETKHSSGFDLHKEISFNFIYIFYMVLFCLRYPKTLIDLSPITIRGNCIMYDNNKLILYSIGLICIILIVLLY